MNSSKYSRYSSYETKPMYRAPWKRNESSVTNFNQNITPLSQFIKDNEDKSNYIEFAKINLNELTSENFNSHIEQIISYLNKNEPKKDEEKLDRTIPIEAIINIMNKGLSFYKSAPVINLLINIKNKKDIEKADEEEYNCDDLILFYLKQICLNKLS